MAIFCIISHKIVVFIETISKLQVGSYHKYHFELETEYRTIVRNISDFMDMYTSSHIRYFIITHGNALIHLCTGLYVDFSKMVHFQVQFLLRNVLNCSRQ